MEQTGIWAPALQSHGQGANRQMTVVHGTDGPAHDEPGDQILVNARAAVPLTALVERGADQPYQEVARRSASDEQIQAIRQHLLHQIQRAGLPS